MGTVDERTVRTLREPPLAWVVIDRPEAHNAMNAAAWRELRAALWEQVGDSEIRVILIRGGGDSAFVSGADIAEFPLLRSDAGLAREYDLLVAGACDAIADAPQPVVAVINGPCFGGGVSLALACDLRFAADDARFAVPAARLGLPYPMEIGVERLVQTVGPTTASDLLLTGRVLTATEAADSGLASRVVPRGSLLEEARDAALRIARGAPLSLAAHKRMIRESLRSASIRDLDTVTRLVDRCYASDDYREGIQAFLEKRPPVFRGK